MRKSIGNAIRRQEVGLRYLDENHRSQFDAKISVCSQDQKINNSIPKYIIVEFEFISRFYDTTIEFDFMVFTLVYEPLYTFASCLYAGRRKCAIVIFFGSFARKITPVVKVCR